MNNIRSTKTHGQIPPELMEFYGIKNTKPLPKPKPKPKRKAPCVIRTKAYLIQLELDKVKQELEDAKLEICNLQKLLTVSVKTVSQLVNTMK